MNVTDTNLLEDATNELENKLQAKEGSCGSMKIPGGFIGDEEHSTLYLLYKVRRFAGDIRKLNLLNGMTQVQLMILRQCTPV